MVQIFLPNGLSPAWTTPQRSAGHTLLLIPESYSSLHAWPCTCLLTLLFSVCGGGFFPCHLLIATSSSSGVLIN